MRFCAGSGKPAWCRARSTPMPIRAPKRRFKKNLPRVLARVQRTHPSRRVQVWFQDEARSGQKGTISRVWAARGSRPVRPRQTEYGFTYLFGAVCPATGHTNAWVMPTVGTAPMQAHLNDLGRQVGRRRHALCSYWIGPAGTPPRGSRYRPTSRCSRCRRALAELNPAEMLWRELRQRYLSNRVYRSTTALERAVSRAWCALANQPERVRRLCNFGWLRSACSSERRRPKTK